MSPNKNGENRRLSRWLDYGSINGEGQSDPCPTCQGTGRIPRGRFQCFYLFSYHSVTNKVSLAVLALKHTLVLSVLS